MFLEFGVFYLQRRIIMIRILMKILFLAAVALLSACGGGGGDGSSVSAVVVPPVVQAIDYSCDKAAILVIAPRTTVLGTVFENFSTQYQNPAMVAASTAERWSLVIDGKNEELNVVIAKPASPSTPINGIIIWAHGQDVTFATQSVVNAMDFGLANQVTNRGYIVVAVARRGNFGSTGSMFLAQSGQAGLDVYIKYNAGTITYAQKLLAEEQYHAASIVAALDKMSKDATYVPYLKNIILMGASGGADAAMQTAADSTVFKAATKKLVVRQSGVMSAQFDSDPKVVPGADEYAIKLAASVNASTLWFQGENDTTTSPGIVACQYKFYAQGAKAAGYASQFYLVPGASHNLSGSTMFATVLSGIFKKALTDQGFVGFN